MCMGMDNNELTQDPNSDAPNNIDKKSYFKILNQKGNFIIVLGVIFIVFLVIVGVYILGVRKNQLVNQDYVQKVNPSQVQPIQPVPNNVNKIAFIRSGEVWIMNEDGTEQKKLLSHTPISFSNSNITPEDNKVISNTFNDQYYTNLAWSKDGTHLAVTAFSKAIEEEGQNEKFELIKASGEMWRWQPPHGNIFLIDVNTGKYQVIESKEKNLAISQVQWSYDNKQIIYARERMGVRIPDEIVLSDVDSRSEKILLTNESDGAENVGLLTWFPEKGEFWFYNGIAYHVDNPEPGLIRFNYLKNQRDQDPLEVTQGYRLGSYWFLRDGRIIYYDRSLGPKYGVDYDIYEIRISNYDGSDSKVIFSGDDCYSQTKEKCTRFFGFSPNGEYALSVKNKIAYYKPFSTETSLFEQLTFGNVEGFKGSYRTTWNKDGNRIAYLLNVSGIVIIQDINGKTQKTIIKDPNITEIKWAF